LIRLRRQLQHRLVVTSCYDLADVGDVRHVILPVTIKCWSLNVGAPLLFVRIKSDPKEHALKLDITRETASMQRHVFVRMPITVDVNGRPYQAPEWGLAGVVLEPFDDRPPPVGTPVALHLTLPKKGALPHGGGVINFDVPGVVESWDELQRQLVVGFLGLKSRERELMAQCINEHAADQNSEMSGGVKEDVPSSELWNEPMSKVDSLMQRLTLRAPVVSQAKPVAPNLVAANLNAGGDLPDHMQLRRSLGAVLTRGAKSAAIGSGYGLLGFAVIGYLGYASYRHLAWLDVSGATIAAPVESILSMGDGAVRWTTFKPGDKVKAGDVVLNIFDNVLEREIEQAAIVVRERENKVTFLKRRLEYERVRMVGLGQVSNQKSLQITAEIEGMRQKLKAANLERRQLSAATPGPLAQVRQRIVGLQQAMALKELELKGRAALADKTDGRMALVGQQLVGDSGTLEAQLEMDEAEVQLAEERHQAFLEQRNRLSVRAPFDGTLRQLTRYDTANIKRGDVAAVIEQSGDRGVRAVVRQDQALRLAVGAKAEVRVPATGQTFAASVAEIEPLSWASAGGETQKPASARTTAEESQLVVRLAFDNPRLLDDQQAYRAGLPVVALIQSGGGRAASTKPTQQSAEEPAKTGPLASPTLPPVASLAPASAAGAGRLEQLSAAAAGMHTSLAPRIGNAVRNWREFSERSAEAVVASSRVWRAKVSEQISSWKQRREQAAIDATYQTGRRG
jgi:multidrug resistance efflux pump